MLTLPPSCPYIKLTYGGISTGCDSEKSQSGPTVLAPPLTGSMTCAFPSTKYFPFSYSPMTCSQDYCIFPAIFCLTFSYIFLYFPPRFPTFICIFLHSLKISYIHPYISINFSHNFQYIFIFPNNSLIFNHTNPYIFLYLRAFADISLRFPTSSLHLETPYCDTVTL